MDNKCKICGGEGKVSKAMLNQLASANDFGNDAGARGTTQSRVGQAQLVDCLKCRDCGHSWIPNIETTKVKHILYKDNDENIPEAITDRNGQVVLSMCKVCGKAEADLDQYCKSTRELALQWWSDNKNKGRIILDFFNHKGYDYKVRPLTNEEIEEIYLAQYKFEELPTNIGNTNQAIKTAMRVVSKDVLAPKAVRDGLVKEKKSFNTDLFKAYINKFSEEDKLKAYNILDSELYPEIDSEWDCSISPTGKCDYKQEDGLYDEDSCKYCDKPEERK